MHTFLSYTRLQEDFCCGAQSTVEPDDYGEIFKNPKPHEMLLGSAIFGGLSSAFVRAQEDKNNPAGQLLSGPKYYLGAWVTSRDMFVWNRKILQHREVAAAVRKKYPQTRLERGLPLYIWYFKDNKTCAVEISEFSQTRKLTKWTDAQWYKLLKIHPAFKPFRIVAEMPDKNRFWNAVVIK